MRIEEETKLDYKDVLIRPKRSTLTSRKDIELKRKFEFKYSDKIFELIPIMTANMEGVGTIEMAKALLKSKMMTALDKHYPLPKLKKFFDDLSEDDSRHIFYTIGLKEEDLEKLHSLIKILKKDNIQNICIDVANGYTERFVEFVKNVREKFPDKVIMAGNVVTPEMTEQLILSGADIVKVGIGPGSTCITRKIAGVGYPQLSAIIECADAAHGIGGMICADGGCEVPGDIAKAFGAGADFVMLGGMLAGHKESESKIYIKNGKKFVEFYGSSSGEAMKKHNGGTSEYRANEGKVVEIPYRGEVSGTIQDILGGLRSTCTYIGAKKLKEIPKRTTFIKVNRQLNDYFS
jgi:GMP reductase